MTVLFLKQRGAERVKLPALLILDDVSQQTLPAQGAFFFLFAATCRWPQPMSSASTRCTGPLSRLSRHSLPSHGRLVAPSALANGGCGEQRLQDIARTRAIETKRNWQIGQTCDGYRTDTTHERGHT